MPRVTIAERVTPRAGSFMYQGSLIKAQWASPSVQMTTATNNGRRISGIDRLLACDETNGK